MLSITSPSNQFTDPNNTAVCTGGRSLVGLGPIDVGGFEPSNQFTDSNNTTVLVAAGMLKSNNDVISCINSGPAAHREAEMNTGRLVNQFTDPNITAVLDGGREVEIEQRDDHAVQIQVQQHPVHPSYEPRSASETIY